MALIARLASGLPVWSQSVCSAPIIKTVVTNPMMTIASSPLQKPHMPLYSHCNATRSDTILKMATGNRAGDRQQERVHGKSGRIIRHCHACR